MERGGRSSHARRAAGSDELIGKETVLARAASALLGERATRCKWQVLWRALVFVVGLDVLTKVLALLLLDQGYPLGRWGYLRLSVNPVLIGTLEGSQSSSNLVWGALITLVMVIGA